MYVKEIVCVLADRCRSAVVVTVTFADDVRRAFHQLSVGGHGIAATGGGEGSLTVGGPEIAMTISVCARCAELESFAELLADRRGRSMSS